MKTEMRTEMKIGLGLFAASTLISRFLAIEFVTGVLLSSAIFFMIVGMISKKNYQVLKKRQKQKIYIFKRLVRMN